MIARKKRNALTVLLSDETNDKGLAMTASFTTMVVAVQFLANIRTLGEYEQTIKNLSAATSSLFDKYSSLLKDITNGDFDRAFFLGGGDLYGCAVESSLKLQEMTDGKVMCKADTFLGVRHGPEAVINGKTLVVYFLSSNKHTRRYELDLMQEIEDKKIGMTKVAMCNKADAEIKKTVDYTIEFDRDGELNVPDSCRPAMDVTVGQLLGLFKSLNLGLRPDTPSERGVINRVVKGVKIYNQ